MFEIGEVAARRYFIDGSDARIGVGNDEDEAALPRLWREKRGERRAAGPFWESRRSSSGSTTRSCTSAIRLIAGKPSQTSNGRSNTRPLLAWQPRLMGRKHSLVRSEQHTPNSSPPCWGTRRGRSRSMSTPSTSRTAPIT